MRNCKKIIIVSFVLVSFVLLLCSCKTRNTTHINSTSGSNTTGLTETSPTISIDHKTTSYEENVNTTTKKIELTFDDFKALFKASNPTKVVTQSVYTIDNVTLNYNSTMVIDYSNETTVKYSYSVKKLGKISIDGYNQFDEIESGVCYAKGSNIGEATEDGIKWNNKIEGSVSILNFNMDESLFEADSIVINGYEFTGKLKESTASSFFKNEIEGTDIVINILASENGIQRIELTYVTKTGATFDSIFIYTYNKETIIID